MQVDHMPADNNPVRTLTFMLKVYNYQPKLFAADKNCDPDDTDNASYISGAGLYSQAVFSVY